MLSIEQINELIQKSQRAETSVEEETLLLEWLHDDPQHMAMLARSIDMEALIQKCVKYENMDTKEAEERLWEKWQQEKSKAPQIQGRKPVRWIWYAAAAVVLVATRIIVYKATMAPLPQGRESKVAQVDEEHKPLPGTDKAILRLANGAEYKIADTGKGFIVRLDDLEFTSAEGVIYCKRMAGIAPPKQVGYHVLLTPRGGRYQLVLPDGSKIWLNSESQIRFPTVDIRNRRIAQLTGEAYFEVAASKKRPFIINANDAEVTVTGTHFNIAAYPNESFSKATLAEGHLSIISGGVELSVTPLHSAVFSKGSRPKVIMEANMDKIMAWKNRQFYWVEGDSLGTVFNEIARWYNVEVAYEGPATTIVNAVAMSRNDELDDVMKALVKSDSTIHYEIKSNKLLVSKQRLHY
jgi:transmembrane sensor